MWLTSSSRVDIPFKGHRKQLQRISRWSNILEGRIQEWILQILPELVFTKIDWSWSKRFEHCTTNIPKDRLVRESCRNSLVIFEWNKMFGSGRRILQFKRTSRIIADILSKKIRYLQYTEESIDEFYISILINQAVRW